MGICNRLFGNTKNSVNDTSLEKDLSKILVRDIMSKQLITTPSSTTVHQISKMMEQGIGSIFVKTDSNIMGIITDRDFAIKIMANKYPPDTPVGQVASIPLHTIEPNESILDAAKQMSTKKIRKLAVIENGKVIGIITSTDLTNQLALIKNKIP